MDSSTLRTLLTRIVHAAADGGCDVAWIEEEKKRPFGYLWPLLSAQIPALDALPLDPPLATWIISSLARPWA